MNSVKIIQSESLTEAAVPSRIIKELVALSKAGCTVELQGTITLSGGIHQGDLNYAQQNYTNLNITPSSIYLDFDDNIVEQYFAAIYGDNIGITQSQADAVQAIPNQTMMYSNNSQNNTIVSLDGLRYFKNATQIGIGSFSYLSAIQKITIPQSVTVLSDSTFDYTDQYENIGTLEILSTQLTRDTGLLLCRSVDQFIADDNVFTNLERINKLGIFKNFPNKVVYLPSLTTATGNRSFGNKHWAGNVRRNLYLPSLTTVTTNAWYSNGSSTGAFSGYSSQFKTYLGTLYLKNITSIPQYTFAISDIVSLVINNTNVPTTGQNSFTGATIQNVYVPKSALSAYQSDTYWSTLSLKSIEDDLQKYATEELWIAAGRPVGALIEAYT